MEKLENTMKRFEKGNLILVNLFVANVLGKNYFIKFNSILTKKFLISNNIRIFHAWELVQL